MYTPAVVCIVPLIFVVCYAKTPPNVCQFKDIVNRFTSHCIIN